MEKEANVEVLDFDKAQNIEVLVQEEVQLDINVPLFYIKSGEEDIKAYVNNHAKPELDAHTTSAVDKINQAEASSIADMEIAKDIQVAAVNQAGQIATENVAEDAIEIVDNHANSVTIPQLQEFTAEAQTQATSAATSASSALASKTSAESYATQAKTSETNAKSYADSIEPERFLSKEMITNCITEIPQDIKLELNDGTLTLKAGSKVYNGNGLLLTKTSDSTSLNANYNGQVMLFMPANGDNVILTAFNGGTVSTLPAIETSYKAYYNTSDGKCYMDAGYWIELSFPIAIGTSTTESWVSIDQVFNGFGYIGSTVFALPGVKGLIPDGRNADGSLRNIEFTVNSVVIGTATTAASPHNMLLTSDNIYFDDAIYAPNWQFVYKEEENIIINTGSNSTLKGVLFGKCITDSNGVITSFQPKLPFRAVDYQDVEDIVNNMTKHVVVSTLPSSPDADTFYYIPE